MITLLALTAFDPAFAAPEVWVSASDPGFPSPIAVDDGACDGNEARFDGSAGQVPVFCPATGTWPPTVRTWTTDPVVVGPDGALPPDLLDVAPAFAPSERAWRASAYGGPDGRRGAVAPVAPAAFQGSDRTAGIAADADIEIGAIVAGAVRCPIHGVPGAWSMDQPCLVPTDAAVGLDLFPIAVPGAADAALVRVEVPLRPLPAAAPVDHTRALGALLALFALLVPVAGAAGFALGRQAPSSSPPPEPIPRPPPVDPVSDEVKASPVAPSPLTDSYLVQQVALLAHPKVREAAEFVAHSEWVDRCRRQSALLIAASDALFARGGALPEGYRVAWNQLVDDLRSREQPVARVAKSLKHLLRDPSLAAAAPMDTVVAWRAIMPHTDVAVTDGGQALADRLRVDLIRSLLFPYVALGQLLTEALPLETGLPKPAIDIVAHASVLAEVLGWRYEHVELYERTDADFMLDRDVNVTGVLRDEVWFGLRPAELPEPGIVLRVVRPRLRPLSGDSRSMRGQVLVLKEEA